MKIVKTTSSLLLLSASLLLIYFFPQMGLLWRVSWILALLFPFSFTLFSLCKLSKNLDEKELELSTLQKEHAHVQTLLKGSHVVIKELHKVRQEKEEETRSLTASLKEMYERAQTFEAALAEIPLTDAQLKLQLEDRTKELFKLEGEYTALQKETTEDSVVERLVTQFNELEDQRQTLETEVLHLEGIISTLTTKKKAPRRKKAKEDLVQLLF